MFNLNKNLSYFVFLHDPDFFLVTFNPVTLPSTDSTISFKEVGDGYCTFTLEESEFKKYFFPYHPIIKRWFVERR